MGEQPDTAEMPVDLDIEVEAMALDENELEHLRQDTRYVRVCVRTCARVCVRVHVSAYVHVCTIWWVLGVVVGPMHKHLYK